MSAGGHWPSTVDVTRRRRRSRDTAIAGIGAPRNDGGSRHGVIGMAELDKEGRPLGMPGTKPEATRRPSLWTMLQAAASINPVFLIMLPMGVVIGVLIVLVLRLAGVGW